jgi:hypothetical protein
MYFIIYYEKLVDSSYQMNTKLKHKGVGLGLDTNERRA